MITTAGGRSGRARLICTDCGHLLEEARPSRGRPNRWGVLLSLGFLLLIGGLSVVLAVLSDVQAPELSRPAETGAEEKPHGE